MPIVDPSMSPEQLEHLAYALIQIGFCSGLIGAAAWTLLMGIFNAIADAITAWEDRRIRVIKARARARALATQGASNA